MKSGIAEELEMEMPSSSTPAPKTARRRWALLIGVVLFFAGPIAYIIQFQLKHLTMPWYIPALATAGLLFILFWVVQRRSLLRLIVLIPFVLLYAYMWISLAGLGTPEYRGPLAKSGKFPIFNTRLANGTKFTNVDLESGGLSALVFFRGRW